MNDLIQLVQTNGISARVCGGWVRDYIMGVSSNDIDLALEGITGEEFACLVKTQYPDTEVKLNPQRTRHLASARIKQFGMTIDCAGLRYDVYDTKTRIPVIYTGTLLQDAQRRDFTINAMYYNLNTLEIEDLCGGVNDIKARIIRTVKDARQSFIDDPLRMLRAVRFASRFQFTLDANIVNACQDSVVINMFYTKVSRERVGQELLKMLSIDSIKLLIQVGLFPHVFRQVDAWDTMKVLESLQNTQDNSIDILRTILSLTTNSDILFESLRLSKKLARRIVQSQRSIERESRLH